MPNHMVVLLALAGIMLHITVGALPGIQEQNTSKPHFMWLTCHRMNHLLTRKLRPSQMKTSESNVKKVVDAICGFTNPFEVENRDELYYLSSGIPANSTVSDNLLQATDFGKKAIEQFIKERLVDRTKKFHDPVTRMKLQTFASTEKRQQVKTSQNKIIEVRAERNIFAQLVLP